MAVTNPPNPAPTGVGILNRSTNRNLIPKPSRSSHLSHTPRELSSIRGSSCCAIDAALASSLSLPLKALPSTSIQAAGSTFTVSHFIPNLGVYLLLGSNFVTAYDGHIITTPGDSSDMLLLLGLQKNKVAITCLPARVRRGLHTLTPTMFSNTILTSSEQATFSDIFAAFPNIHLDDDALPTPAKLPAFKIQVNPDATAANFPPIRLSITDQETPCSRHRSTQSSRLDLS
ncbi:hypothetical protein V1514DRAFT_319822 [Lipomyces japonicus]|uniref:uncharacterized protein n=1 Tax=Lipomyces japonicus TaxID=56871 RepID=UPI0034CD1B3B